MISWFSKIIFLRLMGWKIEGDFPSLNKFVLAVVPHTRNTDFIIGVLTRAVVDQKISYVGKKELFNPLTGWFFRALGGTPINRNSTENKVSSIAKIFKEKEVFRMAIAPEGTRKKVDKWKTGFYYIAMEAEVPILLVNFNYALKQVGFLKLFYPTGNIEKDFKEMESYFNEAMQP
ncbi:MAG: 1-acyl-sn-glycerol-3-phosphate acyltransferase [Flavobacteriaceae bacterium]|jgi:1-acyl-sn-glycerol-3-phosphate acyltransferase|nr:1-acyl-sn-glycerol-3-phosphate acyltransferase [Flavobacteriaceae bacterium]|tara:strand:- start:1132 stop:1656 length:525 start_codon:yes stop_codon:yes gene_type:complete